MQRNMGVKRVSRMYSTIGLNPVLQDFPVSASLHVVIGYDLDYFRSTSVAAASGFNPNATATIMPA